MRRLFLAYKKVDPIFSRSEPGTNLFEKQNFFMIRFAPKLVRTWKFSSTTTYNPFVLFYIRSCFYLLLSPIHLNILYLKKIKLLIETKSVKFVLYSSNIFILFLTV